MKADVGTLATRVERLRQQTIRSLDGQQRSKLGQFFTPHSVAELMASLVTVQRPTVRILDPGAGSGALFAAAVERLVARDQPPDRIEVTAYEIDRDLLDALDKTVDWCGEYCHERGIGFDANVIKEDFIEVASEQLAPADLFDMPAHPVYDLVITNPPYRKIRSSSAHRAALRKARVETSNLYTGFIGLAVQLLDQGGELVAITPRSFCNGPYFRPFRELLLDRATIRHIHIFESRRVAFREDDVLQENIIFKAVRGGAAGEVTVTTGNGSPGVISTTRRTRYEQLVWPHDPQSVIHIVPDQADQWIPDFIKSLPSTLEELRVEVSTGRVVDFRAKEYLRSEGDAEGATPLIYPGHISGGFVVWPKAGRKPNGLLVCRHTHTLLVPSEPYVLVKRFSAKEERRRVVAAIYDPARVEAPHGVGFENHLNYFHENGRGLSLPLAKGLAAFLNTSVVDAFFRQFSGHTQVNATDLRGLFRYPTREQLEALGRAIGDSMPSQDEVDALLMSVI